MNEYKVTIRCFRTDGWLPDIFGKEFTSYVKAESAEGIEREIRSEFDIDGVYLSRIDISKV